MQSTSRTRRALGLLAACTLGLSMALLAATGVANAATVPNTPTGLGGFAGDSLLRVWFTPNDATDGVTPVADTWEYSLASDGGAGNTADFVALDDFTFDGSVRFELTGLTNGTEYTLQVRGVSADGETGGAVSWAATPNKPLDAPGTPTVVAGPSTLKVSWTAPTTTGTFPLVGYKVSLPFTAPNAQSGGLKEFCRTDAATTQCTFGITAGASYDVYVAALDDHGNESAPAGPVASGVVPAPVVPTAVPTKSGDLTRPAGETGSVDPGKKVTLSGSGYAPWSTITVAIYSEPQVLTTVVTDATGSFTVEVTVPEGLAEGEHTLVASGVDSTGAVRYLNLPVTVVGGTTGEGGLAYTGADVAIPAIGGLVALSVGGGLLVVSRRRTAA